MGNKQSPVGVRAHRAYRRLLGPIGAPYMYKLQLICAWHITLCGPTQARICPPVLHLSCSSMAYDHIYIIANINKQ